MDVIDLPVCQLCQSAPATCKSHIIPKQFFKRIRGDEKNVLELRVSKKIQRRFYQNGIWEKGILCPVCDNRLGEYDKYAYEVLPGTLQESKIKHLDSTLSMYELGLIDVDKFKRFLVALIWRALRSKHEMFDSVNDIGPYETRFKNILTEKDTGWLNHVECVFIYFKQKRFDKILLPPFSNKFDGVNVLQFYLYPWKLLIKLDKRPFGRTFESTTIKTESSTFALMVPTLSRGESRIIADLHQKIKRFEGSS